jgi:hypothetical protein
MNKTFNVTVIDIDGRPTVFTTEAAHEIYTRVNEIDRDAQRKLDPLAPKSIARVFVGQEGHPLVEMVHRNDRFTPKGGEWGFTR